MSGIMISVILILNHVESKGKADGPNNAHIAPEFTPLVNNQNENGIYENLHVIL